MAKPKDIDAYIADYSKEVQKLLEQFRAAVKKQAPQAEELISYGIPAFRLNGLLVWFAAHAKHIGFYPRASAIAAFKKDLVAYKTAKGSVQFPLDKPLPMRLINKILKFRIKENLERVKGKKAK